MRVYTIHEPPQPPGDRMDRAEGLVFVREGMSWLALIAPAVWMLLRGLWLALAIYVVGMIVLVAGLALADVPPAWTVAATTIPNLLVALEADSIERWTLERKGWSLVGTVSGYGYADCERRFFEGWLPAQPMIAGAAAGAGYGTLAGPSGAPATVSDAPLAPSSGATDAAAIAPRRRWGLFSRSR